MDDPEDPPSRRMIGRYRLDREIGRGGMGVVYAAYDARHGRSVALKLIAPDIASDAEFASRFMREARIAVTLEHPNVVPVYETGDDDGALFIAMRLVDGADLSTVVHEHGALPLPRVLRIARQIGAALDAAHAHGLVHRDIKPGNVLLTGTDEDEHVYLTDFGLARESASDEHLTGTGEWIGTADYIAPEQIAGGVVSARTDIYSLGCVLYELLTGRVPYGGILVHKLYAHSREPLPSIGRVLGANGRSADEVLARASAKDPADRYPSAGDLCRALAAATTGRATPRRERSVATGTALTGLDQRALGRPPSTRESEVVVSLRDHSSGSRPRAAFEQTGVAIPMPRRTIKPDTTVPGKPRRAIKPDTTVPRKPRRAIDPD